MLSSELMAQIQHLEIRAKRVVNDVMSGQYTSAFHGRGMEFQEVREYVVGDDVRAIDWNVTARTGFPHVKIFREERELTLMLVVDVSPSLSTGDGRTRHAVATEFAAIVAWLALKNQDRVGLLLFSDQIEHFVPPMKGRAHVWRVIKDLYTHRTTRRGTNIELALEHLQKLLPRRATCFLVSDFWSDNFSTALMRCAKQHDLTCVHVRDVEQDRLPEAGLVRWIDSESGETVLVDTSDPLVRGIYDAEQQMRRGHAGGVATKGGADFLELSTTGSLVKPLMDYLRRHEHKRSLRGGK